MSKHFVLLTAAVSLCAITAPAFAQSVTVDDRYTVAEQGEVQPEQDYADGSTAVDSISTPQRSRLGYSAAERNEWLSQCRALRRQYDQPYYMEEEDNDDGGLLGGLLGAIVGGVAGNRIADGDRLAGTLVGAGLGGVAGAVVGSAIDGDDDQGPYAEDSYVIDYCEAYLLNHERGYGQPARIAYVPVLMEQAPVRSDEQYPEMESEPAAE